MTRRLIKRNAHAWTTVTGFWLLFSFLAVVEWRDANRYLGDQNAIVNYGVWSFQLLAAFLAVYFHRTEAPREVLWFGETRGYCSCFIHNGDVTSCFKELSFKVPELAQQTEGIASLAQKASSKGEAETIIQITFRGRAEKLVVSFEVYDNDVLELSLFTHPDLASEVNEVLERYEEKVELP